VHLFDFQSLLRESAKEQKIESTEKRTIQKRKLLQRTQ